MERSKIDQYLKYLRTGQLPSDISNMSNQSKAIFRKQCLKYGILNNKLVSKATLQPIVEKDNVDTTIEKLFNRVPQSSRKLYDNQLHYKIFETFIQC